MSHRHNLASLDALRGIAILLVIVAHFMPPSVPYESTMNELCGLGGVILFFFLSGFLMDHTLSADSDLFAYAARRAFRILPMYWVSLLIVMATGYQWTAGQVLANATFTAPVFGFERMEGVYWTLYIEVLFYCIAPLLHRAGDRTITLAPYGGIVIYSVLWLTNHAPHSGAPFYMIFCLCGMQIGAWYREKATLQHVITSTICAALLIALFIPRTLTLITAPLICCALLIGALTLAPRCQPLERIGHISYSWYLLHFIFGIPIVLNLGKIIPDWSASLIAGIVTLTPSIVTYAVIERPLISFGKGLISLGRDSIPA